MNIFYRCELNRYLKYLDRYAKKHSGKVDSLFSITGGNSLILFLVNVIIPEVRSREQCSADHRLSENIVCEIPPPPRGGRGDGGS